MWGVSTAFLSVEEEEDSSSTTFSFSALPPRKHVVDTSPARGPVGNGEQRQERFRMEASGLQAWVVVRFVTKKRSSVATTTTAHEDSRLECLMCFVRRRLHTLEERFPVSCIPQERKDLPPPPPPLIEVEKKRASYVLYEYE